MFIESTWIIEELVPDSIEVRVNFIPLFCHYERHVVHSMYRHLLTLCRYHQTKLCLLTPQSSTNAYQFTFDKDRLQIVQTIQH
jgi:hypothetical protein